MITGNEKLFKLAVHHNIDNIAFLNSIYALIDQTTNHEVGIASGRFYGVLTKLHDSINNAGHEGRRSEQIKLLWDEMARISDNYEGYLP